MTYVKVTPIKASTIRKAGKYYMKKQRQVQRYLSLVRSARDIINDMAKAKNGEYRIDADYYKRLVFSPTKVLSLGSKSEIRKDILKHSTFSGKETSGVAVNAYKLKEAKAALRRYNQGVKMFNKYWEDEIKAGKVGKQTERKLNITSLMSQDIANERLALLADEYKSLAYNVTLKHNRLIKSIEKAIEKSAPMGMAQEIIDFFTPYLNKIDRHLTYLEGKSYIEYSYEYNMNQYDRLAEALGCRREWIEYLKSNGLR